MIGLTAGMLGGCLWPLSIVGHVMAQIGGLFPHAWALRSLEAANRDELDPHDLLLLVMATVVTVAFAGHRLSRRHQGGGAGA